MAIETEGTTTRRFSRTTGGRPLIQQSGARVDKSAIRALRQDIVRKGGAGAGPEAVQAFAEGELAAEAKLKAEQSAQSLAFRQRQDELKENRRQFNIQASEARKQRKAQQGNFLTGLFGS